MCRYGWMKLYLVEGILRDCSSGPVKVLNILLHSVQTLRQLVLPLGYVVSHSEEMEEEVVPAALSCN
jgi:hypothetical protein